MPRRTSSWPLSCDEQRSWGGDTKRRTLVAGSDREGACIVMREQVCRGERRFGAVGEDDDLTRHVAILVGSTVGGTVGSSWSGRRPAGRAEPGARASHGDASRLGRIAPLAATGVLLGWFERLISEAVVGSACPIAAPGRATGMGYTTRFAGLCLRSRSELVRAAPYGRSRDEAEECVSCSSVDVPGAVWSRLECGGL
jgi:hypothetical protein